MQLRLCDVGIAMLAMRMGSPISPLPATMLTVLALSLAVPAIAVTINNLTVTITVNGLGGTSVFRVTDINDDGVVTLNVADQLVSQIQAAFGTSTFAFPGSYTATFQVDGQTLTAALSSSDTFILEFV